MLIRNYAYINQICGHNHSGLTNPRKFFSPHTMRGYYCQQNTDNTTTIRLDSFPTSTASPYSIVMADSLGLMSATTTLYQSNTFNNLNLAGGLNGESDIVGSSTLSGQLGALAYLISSVIGSNDISANISATVNIASDLAGSGDLDAALGALIGILSDLTGSGDVSGSIAGALSASSDLSGSGDVTANIKGAVLILSDLTGTSDLTSAIIGNWNMAVDITGSNNLTSNITALANLIIEMQGDGTVDLTSGAVPGELNSDISSSSTLSPESLAAAVWNALAANYSDTGSMGEVINSLGAGADPWAVTLPGSYTSDQAGAIVDRLEDLIKQVRALTTASL